MYRAMSNWKKKLPLQLTEITSRVSLKKKLITAIIKKEISLGYIYDYICGAKLGNAQMSTSNIVQSYTVYFYSTTVYLYILFD